MKITTSKEASAELGAEELEGVRLVDAHAAVAQRAKRAEAPVQAAREVAQLQQLAQRREAERLLLICKQSVTKWCFFLIRSASCAPGVWIGRARASLACAAGVSGEAPAGARGCLCWSSPSVRRC